MPVSGTWLSLIPDEVPGGEGAPWRKQAATWFSERLARPED